MSRRYSGKERVMAAFNWEYADRVPISLNVEPCGTGLAGCTVDECLIDNEKALRTAILLQERVPSDIIRVPNNSSGTAAAAAKRVAGGEPPATRPRLEDKSNLLEMKIGNPWEDRFFGQHLELCKRMVSIFADNVVRTGVRGPWTTAAELRGIEQLIYDTRDDPSFVYSLLQFSTELTKVRTVAAAETGIYVMLTEASASCGIISPTMYRQWVKPHHEELCRFFKEEGLLVFWHICGYIDPIMEDIVSVGMDAVSLDAPSSLQKMVELSDKKVVVIGNVETILFVDGTREQMEQAVKKCIDIAAKGSGFILSPGCIVPHNATLERMQYFYEAAEKWGRYA